MPCSMRSGASCRRRSTSSTNPYPNERFCLVTGGIEGKGRLREEGLLVYDLVDIEAACSAVLGPVGSN